MTGKISPSKQVVFQTDGEVHGACVCVYVCMMGTPNYFSDPLAGPAAEFVKAQNEVKMQPPCSKIHKNFKTVSAEH